MKYNSIGEQLITKAQELDPSYKPDKFNDMSEALNIILNNSSSGNNFNLYDCIFNLNNEENFNSETMSLTEVGLNKLNDMFVNGKLLGVNDGDPVLDASNSYFSYYRFLVRNSTHYKFSETVFQDGHMDYIQINIERKTGAIEFIQKILTTTDA